MSETLAMPAALAVGGLGRKGSYRSKAREANREGLHLRPFFVRIIQGWLYFRGGGQRSCVYYLLIIFVRRSVFYRYRITIKYTKKRHYCIIDFHLKVIFNTQRRFFLYSSDKAILDWLFWIITYVSGAFPTSFLTTLNIWKISPPTTNWQPPAMPLFRNADAKISQL